MQISGFFEGVMKMVAVSTPIESQIGTDEIRQIQLLAVLLSALPAKGKLRELLDAALVAESHSEATDAVGAVREFSTEGLKRYLEARWVTNAAKLQPAEAKILEWQKDATNVATAVRELVAAEYALGFRLDVVAH